MTSVWEKEDDMSAVQFNFKRYEKKYVLTPEQYEQFFSLLQQYMRVDQYGVHTICNIYYDTDHYDLIRRSIEKPVYKEKFRLRSYGVPDHADNIFAEIKKKYKGVVYKSRITAAWDSIQQMITEGCILPVSPQIQAEMQCLFRRYPLVPKVYLAYERIAMEEYQDMGTGLRITFDRNIRWRKDNLDLCAGDEGWPVLPEERIIMEVKTPMAVPLWMVSLLSRCGIYPGSFSKYGTCYLRYIAAHEFARKNMLIERTNKC